jgi:hypothetical protein
MKGTMMYGEIAPELLVDWELRKSYSSEELGIEPGLWDYVKKDGSLTTFESLEDTCMRVFDKANKPYIIFGKFYLASQIAREVAWDDWNDYVKDTLSTMCVEGIIRRIN